MSDRKTFRAGAVQMGGASLPRRANPCARDFDVQVLDAYVAGATDRAAALFERAGRMGLDLVLGGEDLQHVAEVIPLPGRVHLLRRYSHSVPGALTDRIGAVARRHGMYVGACFFERAGGRYYNSAVLFDRRGRIVGRYRKVHLPPQEACVLSPGRSLPVFRTELGQVGFLICYDIMFPEAARCLALAGADLVLHPTAGYGWTERIGDAQVVSRAADNDVHVIVACTQRSQVVSPWGDVLADAGGRRNVVIHARLDPRAHRTFPPGHFHRELTQTKGIREELFRERLPRAYRILARAMPMAAGVIHPRSYTAAEKARMRRLLAGQMTAHAEGRPGPMHWTTRPGSR